MIPESLKRGIHILKEVVLTLPLSPGVYRMLSEKGEVLYVGKAKSLKKRVVSYTQVEKLPLRLRRMVAETARMEVVLTATETEALLLESNLIKKLRPRYNILLKDDKAFPYLWLTKHNFPKLQKYRGKRDQDGQYFGPFASAEAVDETLISLQKIFQIRNCSDDVFKNRRRPCLQYYIKRCSAPCVGYISKNQYTQACTQLHRFLSGKTEDVQQFLSSKMEAASQNLKYEEAALYRDRLKLLHHIQTHQRIHVSDIEDADVIAIAQSGGLSCVQIYFYRHGSNYGTEAFFLAHESESSSENLGAFLKQFYEHRDPAPVVLLSEEPEDFKVIKEAFSFKNIQEKITWLIPKAGPKAKLVEHAKKNAFESIGRHLSHKASYQKLFEDIAIAFSLPTTPERIEAYDNSHLFGKQAYGVMVVATKEGLDKKSYRKFMIQTPQSPTGGDDLAMMREVIDRRFRHIGEEGWKKPDLLIIDGGIGQVNAVVEVLQDKGLFDDIAVVGMAKGPARKPGEEYFVMLGQSPFRLDPHSKAFHLLQRLRDEAHRFGIKAHRGKREKNLKKSWLDQIPGIGPKRKKALLLYFGSAHHVANAAFEDLLKVEGVSDSLARDIYNFFHESS